MKIKTDVDIDGNLKLEDYGAGSKTGTATKSLAVDASGNVIEQDLGIDINGLTSTSSLTGTLDAFVIYDQSAGANRKILPINCDLGQFNNDQGFVSDSGNTMTQVTVADDELLVYNNSTVRWESMDVIDFVRDIPQKPTNSSIISLENPLGNWYTSSANSSTTYTLTNANHAGGWACVLINTTSEPTVTGATKVSGSEWVASTNMEMIVYYDGYNTKYYFLDL